MKRSLGPTLAIICLILFLASIGCVERKEKIQVFADGSVLISSQFKADREDELYPGRVPSDQSAWICVKSTVHTPEGNEQQLHTFERSFPSGAALPASYGPERDEEKSLFLQFPTQVLIEERSDAIYYHFKRTYTARPWAYVEALKERILSGRLEKLVQKDPKTLSHDESKELVQGMVRVEIVKKLVFARAAFNEILPEAPQDAWLALAGQLNALGRDLDCDRIAVWVSRKSPEDEAALANEADRFEEAIEARLHEKVLDYCEEDAERCSAFMKRYAWHESFYRITEELAGDIVEITVRMPGEIVGSNANEISENEAVWRFDGRMMRDNDLELLVTTRISH